MTGGGASESPLSGPLSGLLFCAVAVRLGRRGRAGAGAVDAVAAAVGVFLGATVLFVCGWRKISGSSVSRLGSESDWPSRKSASLA